jgi:hypothetical protein
MREYSPEHEFPFSILSPTVNIRRTSSECNGQSGFRCSAPQLTTGSARPPSLRVPEACGCRSLMAGFGCEGWAPSYWNSFLQCLTIPRLYCYERFREVIASLKTSLRRPQRLI